MALAKAGEKRKILTDEFVFHKSVRIHRVVYVFLLEVSCPRKRASRNTAILAKDRHAGFPLEFTLAKAGAGMTTRM